MATLSEKAKGKQRAVDLPDDAEEGSSGRSITIRFTDGYPDVVLTVEAEDHVRDVKRKVRALTDMYNKNITNECKD